MVQPVCFAGFVWRILFPQRVGREVATLVGCHLGLYTSFRFLYQVSRTALMLVSHRCISTLLAGFFVGKLRCSDAREAGWLVACSALSFFFFSLWLLGCSRKRASQIKLGKKKTRECAGKGLRSVYLEFAIPLVVSLLLGCSLTWGVARGLR